MRTRQERLRDTLGRLRPHEGFESIGAAEAFESLVEDPAGEDPATVESAVGRLRIGDDLSPVELGALEAIVHKRDRPAVDVVNDDYHAPPAPWTALAKPETRKRIKAVLPSVCRVEVPGTALGYNGTAFVVAPTLLLTNRHVARAFSEGVGRRIRLVGPVSVDFTREIVPRPEILVDVVAVEVVHPYWDCAVLRVEGLPEKQRPLPLSADDPLAAGDPDVVVIGYPAQDPRSEDLDLQDRIFRSVYGVKRLQPGKLMGFAVHRPKDFPEVEALTHDASTLGGNSGSAVVRVSTGEVVALHFGGRYLEHNFSVPIAELARDPHVGPLLGLRGDGAAPPWRSSWDDVDEAPARRAPASAATVRAPAALGADGSVTLTVPLVVTVSLGAPAAPLVTAVPAASDEAPPANLVVAPDPDYTNRRGYDADFLGVPVPLPAPGRWADDLAPDVAGGLLPYHHFTVCMCASRRLALYTACNVDGSARVAMRREWFKADRWFLDPRLPPDAQIGGDLYAANPLDRGHLVRRLDPVWGASFAAGKAANDDTFHFTNCAPQHEGFNREATRWAGIEDYVLDNAVAHELKVTVLTGPVLAEDDPDYRDRVQLPRAFWKIVVMRLAETGELSATAYLLTQDDLLGGLEETFVYGAWGTWQVSVREVERRTGLSFGDLRDADPLEEAEESPGSMLRAIVDFAKVRFSSSQGLSTTLVPTLPQDDRVPGRERRLAEARERWKTKSKALGSLPAVDGVPVAELPSGSWLAKLAPVLARVVANRAAVAAAWRASDDGVGLESTVDAHETAVSAELAEVRRQNDAFVAGAAALDGDEEGIVGDVLGEARRRIEDIFAGTPLPGLLGLRPKGRPRGVEDYDRLFREIELPPIAGTWRTDETFAWLRVAGPNAGLLRRTDLDDRVPLDPDAFRGAMSDPSDSPEAAAAEERLFVCDWREELGAILVPGETDGVAKFLSRPIGLFAVPRAGGALRPVAIACDEGGPVSTPRDGRRWALAKQVAQVADANHHELVSHLARTHLYTELVALATRQQLCERHPLHVLLVPHLEGTVFINELARRSLIGKDGAIDHVFAGTIGSSQKLAAEGVKTATWSTCVLPKRLDAARTGRIADHPYRDDARRLWAAIEAWVRSYVLLYYRDEAALEADTELTAWAAQLGGALSKGGLPGFPKIEDRAALVEVLTHLIFVPSCQHAAVNFPQKTDMAYAPAISGAGWRAAPGAGDVTPQDRLDFMPPLDLALEQLGLLELLGGVHHAILGTYARNTFPYRPVFEDPRVANGLLPAFRAALREVEDGIVAVNADRAKRLRPYVHLLPSRIPASINI